MNKPATPAQTAADLFNYSTAYPGLPGHKGGETSQEAAEFIAPKAGVIRGKVAGHLASIHPRGATADETAVALSLSPFAVRPRFSELFQAGAIEKTGERRRNPTSTLRATVWRATALLLPSETSPPLVPSSPEETK